MASPLEERELIEVKTEKESDEESFGACFGYDCRRPAKYEVWTRHPDEPHMRFITEYCQTCKDYYVKQIQ